MSALNHELMTELLEAGVHYGHQSKKWNPKMKPFILEERNSIYIIDISQTASQLEAAAQFLAKIVKGDGKVLFVGTKRQAQDAIKEAALATGHFYVNQRWLGGTLTNLSTIRKSVARLREFEAREKTSDFARLNKSEAAALRREAAKLRRNLEGVLEMDRLPDALFVIDTNREQIAIQEASRLKIPVVAIVDTNCDPDLIDYPIAGNDDAIRSIRIILQKIVSALLATKDGNQPISSSSPELAAVVR